LKEETSNFGNNGAAAQDPNAPNGSAFQFDEDLAMAQAMALSLQESSNQPKETVLPKMSYKERKAKEKATPSKKGNTTDSQVASATSGIEVVRLDDKKSTPSRPGSKKQNLNVPDGDEKDDLNTPDASPPSIRRSISMEIQKASKRKAERKRVLEEEAKLSTKEKLSMVCMGHVDAGKSTMMGHLMYLNGHVDKRTMHKFEKESREMGKSSFHFAWIMDEHSAERARGITVDVAVKHFETPSKQVTLLDAPGHRDFIPNMISGASQADVGILVVPAAAGEFEGGFASTGQTKEHAILSKSLGVTQIIVAINKLDTVNWDEERYNSIKAELQPFLKQSGFKNEVVRFIPVSGLTGENIVERKSEVLNAWYKGPTLMEMIDTFKAPPRDVEKPFRLCISDTFKTLTLGQAIGGKIETGAVIPKDRLLLMPLNEVVTVAKIESRGIPVNVAAAGDAVEIGLKDVSDFSAVTPGQYLCDIEYPISLVSRFEAQIITLDLKVPLLKGSQLVLYTQSLAVPCTVRKLVSLLKKSTGEVSKKKPRCLTKNATAIVHITLQRPSCLELYREFRQLGRFTLRRAFDTVAVGIVTEIIDISK